MKRSCAAYGGGQTGRALVLGLLRQTNLDPAQVFTGEGYAPAVLTDAEGAFEVPKLSPAEALDLPDWIWPLWQTALGDQAEPAAQSQRSRAEVALRVNSVMGNADAAVEALSRDDLHSERHPTVGSCLILKTNARRLAQSRAYQDGLVELQDASSQQAVLDWPISPGARVLDFCAGGGGKSLAIAAEYRADVTAHDNAPERMADIPVRAARAGVRIETVQTSELDPAQPFDVVLCDAPCSGSGTWRRTPDAKWRLSAEDLDQFHANQVSILAQAAEFVKVGGKVIYATCSVLKRENEQSVAAFLEKQTHFDCVRSRQFVPSADNDGFYYCVLQSNM